MTAGAKVRGAEGVIISGRCRDISEHVHARFPVFARGRSTLGQSPFTRPSAVQVPLSIPVQPHSGPGFPDFPAAHVNPGDYIVAGQDGVVCVPKDLIEEVAKVAARGQAADEKCLSDIQAGSGMQETFKKHRG